MHFTLKECLCSCQYGKKAPAYFVAQASFRLYMAPEEPPSPFVNPGLGKPRQEGDLERVRAHMLQRGGREAKLDEVGRGGRDGEGDGLEPLNRGFERKRTKAKPKAQRVAQTLREQLAELASNADEALDGDEDDDDLGGEELPEEDE